MIAFLLLTLLFSLQSSPLYEAAAAVYYVKPTQPLNATCLSDHPCLTLNNYTANSERYFTSNSVFLFLSGNHELRSSINVSSICNLTLKPYIKGDTVILYRVISDPYTPVIMRFEALSGVAIINLTLESVSFAFENSFNITLTKLLFTVGPKVLHNSTNSAAISCTRSNLSLAECECLELHNECILSLNCEVFIHHFTFIQLYGSAFSLFGNSIVLQGNAMFLGKNSDNSDILFVDVAAIIGQKNSTVILNGTVTFNGFGRRGAISLMEHSHASILGNTSFSRCGGASVVEDDSVLHLNGTISFTDNYGGAIGMRGRARIHLNGDVTFTNNTNVARIGVAISLFESSGMSLTGYITFSNNFGRAISLVGSSSIHLTGYILFTNNFGGAISLSGSSCISITGDINFTNNTADIIGGAVALSGGSSIHLTGNITFTNNIASSGGAIYLSNGNGSHLNGDVIFTNNTASVSGGAIALSKSSTSINLNGDVDTSSCCSIYLNGDIVFTNNTARYGGAISLTDIGSIYLKGDVTFRSNSANTGGAISIADLSSITMQDNVTFIGNTAALYDGGAIVVLHPSNLNTILTLPKPDTTLALLT